VISAILYEPNRIDVATTAVPDIRPGDLLLRMRAATICGTDIRIFRGKKTLGVRYPSVLGHEFAGEIIESGGHPGFAEGSRVGVCPSIPCGRCDRCKRGLENLCADSLNFGYELDGGFAEIVRIPAAAVAAGNVRLLPETMSYGEAALVEPLACVLNGQEKAGVGFGDTVLVIGAGPIGCLHVLLAQRGGAERIVVSDPNLHRREEAARCGASVTVDPTQEDLRAVLHAATGGRGADVVICAIGIPALARQATDLVRHGGRLSLFAGFSKGETAEMDVNAIHYNEITVTGAFGLTRRTFDMAFDMVASGGLDVAPLITASFPLQDAVQAFGVAETGSALKVALINE